MNTFKDRLISLFDKDAKPSHIAASVGMSIPGFMRIFNDGFIPKADGLIKIHEVTGCSITWLLTGNGTPFPDSGSNDLHSSRQNNAILNEPCPAYDVFGRPVDVDEFVFIPRYDVKAAAGHGCYNESDKPVFTMAFRRYWIENYLRADPKDLSVISVKGDSMEGVLNDGDNILVNHAKKSPGDGLYVLRMGENLIVKRTQLMPDNMLWVTSANDAYEPFGIDISKPVANIEVVGKVEWFGRKI